MLGFCGLDVTALSASDLVPLMNVYDLIQRKTAAETEKCKFAFWHKTHDMKFVSSLSGLSINTIIWSVKYYNYIQRLKEN